MATGTRPRRAEVREQVVAAARQAFGEHGYAAVSVSQVAERAGFTKGAVYSNFGGKPELFAAAVQAYFSELVGSAVAETLAATGPGADPVAVLAARLADDVVGGSRWPTLLAEFRVLAAGDPGLRAVYAELRTAQRDSLVAVLREPDVAAALRPGLDTEVAAVLLLTCVHSLAVEHAVAPAGLPRTLVEAMLAHVVAGILA